MPQKSFDPFDFEPIDSPDQFDNSDFEPISSLESVSPENTYALVGGKKVPLGSDEADIIPRKLAPIPEGPSIGDRIKSGAQSAYDFLLKPQAPSAFDETEARTSTAYGTGNPLVEAIWPGGISVPGGDDLKTFLKEAYEEFVRPATSPLGVLGSIALQYAKSPAAVSTIPRPSQYAPSGDIVDVLAPEQRMLGTGQKALPPAPSGRLVPPEPKGPFIGGEMGVAEPRLYPIDTGPVRPNMGEMVKGDSTILPRELGEINQISPDLAARSGTTLGRLIPFEGLSEPPIVPLKPIEPVKPKWEDLIKKEPSQLRAPDKLINDIQELNRAATSSEMKVPGVNPTTGRENIAVGGADERVLDVLGTALYSRDRPATVAKELLQNSVDELKISGNTGPVRIAFQYSARNPITNDNATAIVVQDHGRGMGAEDLYTIFTDVGKTGKGGESSASGGFGFAKAAPLLGGEYVKIESVTIENGEKVKYTFEGNPKDLKNQKKGVPLKSEPTDAPTGFKVEVYFPSDKSLYSAGKLVNQTVENSPGLKGIEFLDDYSSGALRSKDFLSGKGVDSFSAGSNFKQLEGKPVPPKVDTIKTSGADVDIHYELDDKTRNEGELVILNNGLYALGDRVRYAQSEVPHVPGRIVANVKATVEEGAEGYPFSANRESISTDLSGTIREWVKKNITEGAETRRIAELQKVFDSLKPAPGNDFVVLDSGNRYTPEELAHLNNSDRIRGIGQVMDLVLQDLSELFPSRLGDVAKFGFIIADPEQGGINIPSPAKKGKFAVMVGPFSAIKVTETPEEASSRMTHVMIHEFTHNLVRSEGAGFTWELSKVYAKFPLEKQLDAKNTIRAYLTGEEGDYAPEIQALLQEYTESRGRPATQEDTLSRERASEWIRAPRQTGNAGSNKPDGKGAVKRLLEAIKTSRGLREEQENLYSSERGKRFGAAGKVKTPGFKGHFQRLKKLGGELPKVEAEPIKMNEKDTNALIGMIMADPSLQMGEKIRATTGLSKILGIGEGVPQRSELKLLGQVFGPEIEQLVQMYAGVPVTRAMANEVFNFTKAQMASGDMSFPFRQGLPLIARKEWWQSWGPMIQQMQSKAAFEGAQAAVTSDPAYGVLQKAGVRFADVGERLEKGEEMFKSNLAAKLPWVRISEQGYVGFANNLRLWTAKNLMKEAEKAGAKLYTVRGDEAQPTQVLRDIAKFVNNHTGVGSLDFRTQAMKEAGINAGNLEKIAPELNFIFWSPRLQASKARRYSAVFNPKFWTQLNPIVRKESLKSLLAVAGFIGITNAVGQWLGGEGESDPTDSDFGKVKFGNTRLDPGGGDLQYVVAASKFLSALRKQASGIKMRFGQSAMDVVGNFGRSKESPIISFAHDIMANKDMIGRPVKIEREVQDMALPMVINITIEIMQEDPELAPLIPLAVGGMGVQVQSNQDKNRLRPIQAPSAGGLRPAR